MPAWNGSVDSPYGGESCWGGGENTTMLSEWTSDRPLQCQYKPPSALGDGFIQGNVWYVVCPTGKFAVRKNHLVMIVLRVVTFAQICRVPKFWACMQRDLWTACCKITTHYWRLVGAGSDHVEVPHFLIFILCYPLARVPRGRLGSVVFWLLYMIYFYTYHLPKRGEVEA